MSMILNMKALVREIIKRILELVSTYVISIMGFLLSMLDTLAYLTLLTWSPLTLGSVNGSVCCDRLNDFNNHTGLPLWTVRLFVGV